MTGASRLRACARFGAAREGNVAMLWALCAAIIVAMIGLGVDFARAQSLRAQMQNAVDGAALVAERSSSMTLEEREAAARAFFEQALGGQGMTHDLTFRVIQLEEGGHRVEAALDMDLGLSRLINPEGWRVAVQADAMSEASPPIEVALVLDNTGSMSGDMDTLRDGAEEMIDFLFAIDGDTVKMSLVPFVAQVNIGNSSANRNAWMDTAGTSPMNGELLEDRQIGWRSWGTSSGTNCQNLSTLPYSSYTGAYRVNWVRYLTSCRAFTPDQINYFDLYPSNDPWKGCVEMRPAPYDIQDDPPTDPARRFTPFFWVDTYDSGSNSYLTDSTGNITSPSSVTMTSGSDNSPTTSEQRTAYTFNVFKYRNQSASIDNTAPDTRGPNRGCPTPIVPLTSNRDAMVDAARAMEHWNGGGTNQLEGLAWGWRVLSPGAPFTEGAPYGDDVRKVIVLMSDGRNTNVGSDSVLGSDYSSLNHLGLWRDYQGGGLLGTLLHGVLDPLYQRNINSSSAFVQTINDRQRLLCTNIKNAGVEIYTVMFRETDGEARDIMRTCASDLDHYFTAENQEELRNVFRAIGSGIGQLRLTR